MWLRNVSDNREHGEGSLSMFSTNCDVNILLRVPHRAIQSTEELEWSCPRSVNQRGKKEVKNKHVCSKSFKGTSAWRDQKQTPAALWSALS